MLAAVFDDPDFQDALATALAAARRGAADEAEVLATAARVTDGDADSWLREWTGTGGGAWAAGSHRWAATYYAAALALVDLSSEPERRIALWRRQRECWERAVDGLGGERIAIPYGGGALPGWFFRAPGAAQGERRPLVVVNQCHDGATSHAWVIGGAAAAERGYHWMTFDGPGQQAALVELGLPARPDWEAVLGPVADALTARRDVDAGRMAMIGAGQAGLCVARALAFEHRFAAAVADPGVVDAGAAWAAALPPGLRAQLARGDAAGFDRDMHLAELFAPALTAQLRRAALPYGVNGSRFALFRAVAEHRLGGEAARIATPLLVTERAGERRWPGQSRQLLDLLPGPNRLARGGEAEIFAWIDAYLA